MFLGLSCLSRPIAYSVWVLRRQNSFGGGSDGWYLSKVGKIYTTQQDNTMCAVELFISSPELWEPVFKRAMAALKYGKDAFVTTMQVAPEE